MALKKARFPGDPLPMNAAPPVGVTSGASPNAEAPPNTSDLAADLLAAGGLSNRSATGSSDVPPNGLLVGPFAGLAKGSGLRAGSGAAGLGGGALAANGSLAEN